MNYPEFPVMVTVVSLKVDQNECFCYLDNFRPVGTTFKITNKYDYDHVTSGSCCYNFNAEITKVDVPVKSETPSDEHNHDAEDSCDEDCPANTKDKDDVEGEGNGQSKSKGQPPVPKNLGVETLRLIYGEKIPVTEAVTASEIYEVLKEEWF